MIKLCDSMSQNAKSEERFHNPKVGGSIPPPDTTYLTTFQRVTVTSVFSQFVALPPMT